MDARFATARRKLELVLQSRAALGVDSSTFVRHSSELFGKVQRQSAGQTIAMRMTKPGQPKPTSAMVQVGEVPEGFGKQVLWEPSDAGQAAVIFLSAADPLGVMISGVRGTDSIEIVSATGIASFSEDTKNEGAGSIIGVIAAGATVAATSFGAPALVPLIEPAAEFAKTQFKEEKVKTKRRDPFGEDPGSGHKARQEGGVLVSMPAARQTFYSGNADHKERWIAEPGVRDDAHRPSHVKGAFFLMSGSSNHRVATADGDIIIYPWDHKFEDNFGFYRLHVLLRRGSGQVPVVE